MSTWHCHWVPLKGKKKKTHHHYPLYKYPQESLNSASWTYFPFPKEFSLTWNNTARIKCFSVCLPQIREFIVEEDCSADWQFNLEWNTAAASSRLSASLLTWGHFFKPGVNSSLTRRALLHFLDPFETVTLLANTQLFFLKQLLSIAVFHNIMNSLTVCVHMYMHIYICVWSKAVSLQVIPQEASSGSGVRGSDSHDL